MVKKSLKKGRLSKAETFYIENNPENLTIEAMAAELNRSEATIQAAIDKAPPKPKTNDNINTKPPTVEEAARQKKCGPQFSYC